MSKVFKIASVCRALPTPDDPGAGLFVMRRLEAMSQMSALRVLQPIPWFPGVKALPDWACRPGHESLGVIVEHAPMFYLPKFMKRLDSYWLYRAVKKQLALMHARGELDLVDAHFAYPDGVGCVRAAQELGVPAFITLRGVEEDYLRIPAIAGQMKAAIASAAGCICVSHSLRDVAISAGADLERVTVIHNAVNRALFQSRDRNTARQRLGIDNDARIVVAVGNLLSVKRHDVLVKALAELKRTIPSVQLVIIGSAMHEPEYPAMLRELCRKLGVADCVIFAGRKSPEEVANWLNAADVFALASRREGCCNAVLEALASGVPVVATDVGDNRRFIEDGNNGFIVPVDDSLAMSQAIATALVSVNWDRDHISRSLKVGDWDSVAGDVMMFYAERMEEAQRRA